MTTEFSTLLLGIYRSYYYVHCVVRVVFHQSSVSHFQASTSEQHAAVDLVNLLYFFRPVWSDNIDFVKSVSPKIKYEVCESLLCLDLVSFSLLSQIKPQAPLLVRYKDFSVFC